MTEKRFKLDSEVGFIDTQKCGGDTMTLFEVVVELNKLNEENEQLKNIIVFAYTLMSSNTISDEEYHEFYESCENMGVSLND